MVQADKETQRENLILDVLLVYLFETFTELSIIFSYDKKIYKKLLISMNSNIDLKAILDQHASNAKKQNIKFSRDDIDILKEVTRNIIRIHQVTKGLKSSIEKIPMMKKLNLTDDELIFIRACTIKSIEVLISEIS